MTRNCLAGGVVFVDGDLTAAETDMADPGTGIEKVEVGAVSDGHGFFLSKAEVTAK